MPFVCDAHADDERWYDTDPIVNDITITGDIQPMPCDYCTDDATHVAWVDGDAR